MAAPIRGLCVNLRLHTVKVCQGQKGVRCFSAGSGTQASEDSPSLLEKFKQASKLKSQARGPMFMTQESDPANHKLRHTGLFYRVPPTAAKSVLGKGMHLEFYRVIKGFNELSLMIRKPSVELLHYLRTSDYNNPVHRYLLYGSQSVGKSTCLAHIMHYCHMHGWLIVHVPWAAHWNIYFRETAMSTSRPGRMELPIEGIEWLQWFRTQNAELLKTLDLKTTSTYIWSKREKTEEGSSINEIIDLGLARSKYSNDCVAVILKEIKRQAQQKRFRALVAVDGINAFWQMTNAKTEDRTIVPASDLTLVHNFKKLIQNDWTNGAVVGTVDNLANQKGYRDGITPRYLLGKEGFDVMDPFVPIHVENYSDKEVHSQLEYFIDRKWIQNPKGLTEEGKKELIFLSGKNPGQLRMITYNW